MGKKCSMMIQWDDEEKSVEYYSSSTNQSIVESAMKVFNISIPIEQLVVLTADRKELSRGQTIPFEGYPSASFILHQKALDSSDYETNVLCIDCEGEVTKYCYDPKKTIQEYFNRYINDKEYEEMKDDTCLTTKNRLVYNVNSTLGDLNIKPNDVLYFMLIEESIQSLITIYYQPLDRQIEYGYEENKKVIEYLSSALKVMILPLFHV